MWDILRLDESFLLLLCKEEGDLELTNIIMIGLAKCIPEYTEQYELHRLLGTLLSDKMPVDEKISIIEQEYDIPAEKNAEEDMMIMCNLGQGIEDRAMVQGMEKEEAKIISCMYKNGLSVEKIAEVTEKDIEKIQSIIKKNTVE